MSVMTCTSYDLRTGLDVRVAIIGLVCAGGKIEWSGDWSDYSLLWTADLKEELGFTAKDDGTFWMCLVDFASRFEVGCP
jgi:hypothetical protein